MKNCRNILTHKDMNVVLRCNYTFDNAQSFWDLPFDLERYKIMPSESLSIDFRRVWQDSGSDEETCQIITNVQKVLKERHYRTESINSVTKTRCYAERSNHVVVNFDGNLFHCTARDFTPENAEGVIGTKGDLLFNEKAFRRQETKWGNQTCFNCIAYPICHGLCSQQKYEHLSSNGCLANRTDVMKKKLIEQRIITLIDINKQLQLQK